MSWVPESLDSVNPVSGHYCCYFTGKEAKTFAKACMVDK